MKKSFLAVALMAACAAAQAQTVVKHIQTEKSPIASGVWAGDTFYLSGQLPSPGADGQLGDIKEQATSIFNKIQAALKEQGLDMKDVVKMTVFAVGDPKNSGKLDFAGLQAAYTQFFGTKDQPNKPARSAVQVAALVNPAALLEIEVIAVKGK